MLNTLRNRFNIPAQAPPTDTEEEEEAASETSVGSIFLLLEENKAALGLEFYSVSVSTLDEVFLAITGHGTEHADDPENTKSVDNIPVEVK